MTTLDVLYIVLSVAVVVITVTIVWLAGDLKSILASLRKSASDTETMTRELKEKVLLITEALDRVGTTATKIIGMIEEAVETVREKKDQVVNSIGLVAGLGQFYKNRKTSRDDEDEEKNSSDEEKDSQKDESQKVKK